MIVTIRQLAQGTGLVGNPMQQQVLKGAAQQLVDLVDTEEHLESTVLDESLSPATHHILADLRDHHEATASTLRHAAISLRGLYSQLTNEEMSEPYDTDVLVSDVNELTLVSCIVPQLHKHGLGPEVLGATTEVDPFFPVRGILFGTHLRPMVTLIFELNGRKVFLPVLIDTGGQLTTLNEHSWRLLDPQMDMGNWDCLSHRTVLVQGVPNAVYLGMGQTKGVNMVGNHWLRAAGVMIVAGYLCEGCVLMQDNAASRQQVPDLPCIA